MSFDMNKLMQQAAEMQAKVQQMQEEAVKETAEASVGGGLVKVTANGAGAVLSITISPDAIDPSDPEALGDLVLAGVNEALRSAAAKVEAKAQQMQAEMLQAQEKLKDEVVEASAGGGMVKVKMGGDLTLREISIDPEAIDPEEAEMLAEMVQAAVNEALRAAQELAATKMGGIGGGLGGGLGALGG